jgi:guanylate kinase
MSNSNEFYPLQHQPLLVVISGPSGAGKDSVLQSMRERGVSFHFVVTATTRPPRSGEVHGVDYYFYSQGEFTRMIENGELLEYARVYDDYKGIPKAQVRQALDSGKDVVLRVDVQGAETIRKLCPEAVLIFLTVEDEKEMERRLQMRHSESPDSVRLRIVTARKELQRIKDFDYLIVNREARLDETVDKILAIIQAEHQRVMPRKVTL